MRWDGTCRGAPLFPSFRFQSVPPAIPRGPCLVVVIVCFQYPLPFSLEGRSDCPESYTSRIFILVKHLFAFISLHFHRHTSFGTIVVLLSNVVVPSRTPPPATSYRHHVEHPRTTRISAVPLSCTIRFCSRAIRSPSEFRFATDVTNEVRNARIKRTTHTNSEREQHSWPGGTFREGPARPREDDGLEGRTRSKRFCRRFQGQATANRHTRRRAAAGGNIQHSLGSRKKAVFENEIFEALADAYQCRISQLAQGLEAIQNELGVGPDFQMPF